MPEYKDQVESSPRTGSGSSHVPSRIHADASPLCKIITGGQTGVDRAALDVAIQLGIPHGGWCPKNRRAEGGQIPPAYELKETDSTEYCVRTEKNVVDADGTLILYRRNLMGGTHLTLELCQQHRRPHLCLDLDDFETSDSLTPSEAVLNWVKEHGICVLNVAGPRESSSEGITELAQGFLLQVFGSSFESNFAKRKT